MTATRHFLRLFSCARCRKQVLICSTCDRGNIYCSRACSHFSRQESVRQASRRYQRSPPGARNHARRQTAYRRRQKKVTHQGIAPRLRKAKRLRARPRFVSRRSFLRATGVSGPDLSDLLPDCCHFCGCESSGFHRRGFLGRKETP
jgi:hypothetical protein